MADDKRSSLGNALAAAAAFEHGQTVSQLASCAERLPGLVRRLTKFSFPVVAATAAGLLTNPENHACTLRLELLIHLAAMTCRGRNAPAPSQLREWLNKVLLKDIIARQEDPTEDVFLSNVVSWNGNTRVFEGLFEGNADYLQPLLAALLQLDETWARDVSQSISSILALSDVVAARAGLTRYVSSTGQPRQPIKVTSSVVADGISRVTFNSNDLRNLSIQTDLLEPFLFLPEHASLLSTQTIGHTLLERRPLLIADGKVIVALPTAISASIRRYVLEAANEARALDRLQAALERVQQNECTRTARFGWDIQPIESIIHDEELRIDEFVGCFDEGSFVHVLLAHDSLQETVTTGLMGQQSLMKLRQRIEATTQRLASQTTYRRGLTLIIHGGIGRGFSVGFEEAPTRWQRLALGIHDFALLGWDHQLTALRAWKLLEHEDQLRTEGIDFFYFNGFGNLYAYAQNTGYSLVPEDETPNLIHIGTNFITGLRQRLRKEQDRHAVRSATATGWLEVQRRSTSAFFEEKANSPIYINLNQIDAGILASCVEAPRQPWWIEGSITAPDARKRSIQFQIWDLVVEWSLRLAPVIDTESWALPRALRIQIDFPELDNLSDRDLLEGEPTAAPAVNANGNTITIQVSIPYLRAFATSRNTGDRMMVAAIIDGVARVAGQNIQPAQIDELSARVVPNDDARFFHTLPANDPIAIAQAAISLPDPRFVQDEDRAWSRLRLAKITGYEGTGIVPAAKAQELLHTAVDVTWQRISANLQQLNRESIVERSLVNALSNEMDRLQWRQTAAALRALHEDTSNVIQAANERENRRALAAIASRALVEMAICTSPVSGARTCGETEFDNLLALVSTMLECAAQSDAIRYDLATKELSVTANGSIKFDGSYLEAIQRPYMHSHGERTFLSAADDYASIFDSSLPSEGEVDKTFLSAFTSEFVATPEQYFQISAAVTRECIRGGIPILKTTKHHFLRLTESTTGVESKIAERIYDAFVLRPRPRWDESKPKNAKARDWYPWRFNRRLSVSDVLRPPFEGEREV